MAKQAQLSFEFFPPRTEEGLTKLITAARKFVDYQPTFFSVTFGAGGSTRERTLETVLAIHQATRIDTAPHISCVGSSKADIADLLKTYQNHGINRLVVLRGDTPSGIHNNGELRHADELVRFIREQTGDHFYLHVAAYPEYHPESDHPIQDFNHFKNKLQAGADEAITQYFYNPDAYFELIDTAVDHHIDAPITPGIMPITNYTQLARFSDACSAEIPRWIRQKLAYFHNKEDSIGLREFGEHVVTMLCETLLNNGASGLHFYTLNQFEPAHHILQNLLLSKLSQQAWQNDTSGSQ